MSNESISQQVEREAEYGIIPVAKGERLYGMLDAFLVLSGYGVATWCYTQGSFMATMVNFKQLLTTTFGANLFILGLYLLPVVFATKYGIDMWQWLKAVFGTKGIRIMVVVIIGVNFPWFGVCADIFASTMINLFNSFGVPLPPWVFKPLALLCIALGTALAILGPVAIKWVNRLIVPALILIGIAVVVLAFTSVPMSEILAYQPDISHYPNRLEPYMCAVEAGLAFGISWCCSTAVVPRLCHKERDGYWATVGAYGLVTPLFIMAGGVLSIVTLIKYGVMGTDLALMLAQLSGPVMALCTLALVAFANIGTHGTGCYLWSVVLKSAFPKTRYWVLVLLLSGYATLIVLWGKIIEYFGAMISLAAYVYGPVMALLFIDYFIVRKRKLDLRSAFEFEGHNAYFYKNGYNILGFICVIAGVVGGLVIFDAIEYTARYPIFNYTTSTMFGFIVSGFLYLCFYMVPTTRKFMLQDRSGVTV